MLTILLFLPFLLATADNQANEEAHYLIKRYRSALRTRNIGEILEVLNQPFKLTHCNGEEETYDRQDVIKHFKILPDHAIQIDEPRFENAKFEDGPILDFIAKFGDRAEIHFRAKRIYWRYRIFQQVEKNCKGNVVLTAMIKYEKAAEAIGKEIMTNYINAISQRSLTKLYALFDGSYHLKYCTSTTKDYHHKTFNIFDLQMPFYQKDEKHETYKTKIRNGKMKKNGDVSFEVYGGGFDNHFEVIREWKTDAYGYSIAYDKDLRCYAVDPTSLNFYKLQYSVFE